MRGAKIFLTRKESDSIINTILFQKYNVLSLLGSGGSSNVYLVEHIKLKAYRAIKCIPKAQMSPSSIYLEAYLLKNLNHPGIPIIYDIEEDLNYFYIIEEYIKGESLHNYMQNNNKLSQKMVILFSIQLCEIIGYLHNQTPYPILYLDLKPEHIILCGNQLKLIDFDASTCLSKQSNIYQYKGTKGFAAPELYSNLPCDVHADVFGIGTIIYFMLTNQKMPMNCEIKKNFYLKIKFLSGYQQILLPRNCSKNLKLIIQKSTAYLVQDRYPSVVELKEKLNQELLQTKKHQNKHLLTNIVITGCQKRIGTTHIAISIVCYLNNIGINSFYEEKNNQGFVHALLMYKEGFGVKDDLFQYGNFKAKINCGRGVKRTLPHGVCVQDYGNMYSRVNDISSDNFIILVTGGREWEYDNALKAFKNLRNQENLKIICNYHNRQISNEYAKKFQKKIFCFPLDPNAFQMTKKKNDLFRKLL